MRKKRRNNKNKNNIITEGVIVNNHELSRLALGFSDVVSGVTIRDVNIESKGVDSKDCKNGFNYIVKQYLKLKNEEEKNE